MHSHILLFIPFMDNNLWRDLSQPQTTVLHMPILFPQRCNSISIIQLNGVLDHKQLPTFSPTTWQWLGTHQCVCKCDKFVVPMWNSFSVVTLIDQRDKILCCQSHGVPNFIWQNLIFGDPQHGSCFISTFWHLRFLGGAYIFGKYVDPTYTIIQICMWGHY